MKRILTALSFLLMGAWGHATHLQPALDHLIHQVDPNMNLGMEVIDLTTGEHLYEHNATQLFVPASNMKLFSNAAALLALGPEYRFLTQLKTTSASLQDGTLKGTVYLELHGDPSLTQNHLNALFASLTHLGINTIQGDVVLVSHHQGIAPYAPGVMKKDANFSYGASVAPLILDENRITVTINPAYKVGAPALIELSKKTNNMIVHNHVTTSDSGKGCGLSVNMNELNELTVSGCIKRHQAAYQHAMAIRNPLRYAENQVKMSLAASHIRLDGQIVTGHLPTKTLLLATHASKPLTQIMADTLKPSDNLYADTLFLQTAASVHGAMLNWTEAQPVVKRFLEQQTGIGLQNATLIDGSGLSRNDRVTPEQTVQLLRYLHARFPLAYEYIAALPIAGQDGTLQRRFRLPKQRGLIRAKTGTMTGVIGLSGYLYTANGHTLAFSIYSNTRKGTPPNISGRYRSLIDTLCDFLLKQRPDDRHVITVNNPHAQLSAQHVQTLAEKKRQAQQVWRRLEFALKKALQQQNVNLLFRKNQIVLIDHTATPNTVWGILQTLQQKHPFAVALSGSEAPLAKNQGPCLLWIHTPQQGTQRTWTLSRNV